MGISKGQEKGEIRTANHIMKGNRLQGQNQTSRSELSSRQTPVRVLESLSLGLVCALGTLHGGVASSEMPTKVDD